MKTPDYHNPQNVPESALQPGERFLLKEEVNSDLVLRKCADLTYKTTLPLPAEYLEGSLTIEAGKSYRTRSGNQAEIFRTYPEQDAAYGAVLINGKWEYQDWRLTGSVYMANTTRVDLVAPWNEPEPKPTPEVNWSAMPAWAEWVCSNEGNDWWWYESKPTRTDDQFWRGGLCGRIPREYIPTFTGHWKDSLAQRGGAA